MLNMSIADDGKVVRISVGGAEGRWAWGWVDTCCGDGAKILRSLDTNTVWDKDNPANNMKLNRLVSYIIETLELHAS